MNNSETPTGVNGKNLENKLKEFFGELPKFCALSVNAEEKEGQYVLNFEDAEKVVTQVPNLSAPIITVGKVGFEKDNPEEYKRKRKVAADRNNRTTGYKANEFHNMER